MTRPIWPAFAMTLLLCTGIARAADADDLSDIQRLYYSGQVEGATRRLDQLLAAKPKDPQLRFLRGVMLADAKRHADAVALFRELVQDYPDLAEPYNNLAALYAAEGDYAKARATLEQALRNNPGYSTAHENLGDVYAALAAQSYGRAIKLEPTNTTVPTKLQLMRELYQRNPIAAVSAPPTAPAAKSATP